MAHGSLFMIGAFAAAWVQGQTGSFLLGLLAGLAAAGAAGVAMEIVVLRRLYGRDHLDQVVATFGLILFFNEAMAMIFGRRPLTVGVPYPVFRLAIIVAGLAVAGGLYWLIGHTRLGMLLRAGATNREMVRALGVDIGKLTTAIFALGALLAGLAGVLTGPLPSVQVGMGDRIAIATFVVIVIGGLGSVRCAFAGAMLVGMVDTLSRAFLPALLRGVLPVSSADAVAAGLASMSIFILMALVLLLRPRGLFPAHG
jgi:branched-chain amino acid transport system permease protein